MSSTKEADGALKLEVDETALDILGESGLVAAVVNASAMGFITARARSLRRPTHQMMRP